MLKLMLKGYLEGKKVELNIEKIPFKEEGRGVKRIKKWREKKIKEIKEYKYPGI